MVRRWRLAALVAGCLALGALVAVLIVPNYFADASATSVSTIYKTATNVTNGSSAASSDAPGGAKTGTAKPGDTLKWVVDYQNNTTAPASVNLKDVITNAGAYVNGSLQVPPNQNAVGTISPQYTTNAGTTWATGTPPANANGVGFTGTLVPQGTEQRSINIQQQPSTAFSTTGGDGYNVAMRNGLTYAAYHHNTTGSFVYCSQQDGSVCPGWSAHVLTWSSTSGTALGTGTTFDGNTGWENGTWISGTKMFFFAATGKTQSPAAVGTGCVDLSTTPPKSCGFTQFDIGSSAYIGAQIGSTGIPASNGNIYAVAQTTTGAKLFCVSVSTGANCGVLALNSTNVPNVAISSATFGNYVFANVPVVGGSWLTYCYIAGGALCSGAWPVANSSSSALAGADYAPFLSATGILKGVCTIPNGNGSLPTSTCWNLAGTALVSSPYAGTGAKFTASGNAAGDAFVQGTKVYISGGNTVLCVDFATYPGSGTVPFCNNFTPPTNNINYTVRSASQVAPNCLVADGDGAQILFFNGITGGGCSSVSAPVSLTVTPLNFYCGSGAAGFRGWGSLTLPGAVASAYTNATITLRDQNSNVITGFNGVTLASGASLSLATIPTSVTSITASVTINGINDPTGVVSGQVAITWQGDPPQMCFQTIAPPVACDAAAPLTLSNTANAVTTSASGSDAPNGNTTGVVQFSDRASLVPADSQCSLVFQKVASVQTARPGDKVTYTINVTNAGTQAYVNAAFSDDLTDVLKDATYNNDQSATSGTVSYAAPTLSWSGALAGSSGRATITYSVTVKSPDTGDHSLTNTVVSSTPGNGCASGSSDPRCTATVAVQVTDVLWKKIDATGAKNILTGAAFTFTPVDGAGKPTGPPIVVTDCQAASPAQCTGSDIDPIGGQFRLTNLGPGTYQLVETRAPVGFKLDPTPIPVTITSNSPISVSLADVVNKQLPVPAIPLTGGLGTDALTIAGGGLLATVLGLVVWQLIRHRRTA
ncbi:conserved repeat domain-containing protein [Leifsonia sp. CL147]|nr:conserved repeat domain-containing protein [Leifsonia sp. CL154]SFL41806.1 conserved repeat domain-containing protein [Leifsonia sp. CL147]